MFFDLCLDFVPCAELKMAERATWKDFLMNQLERSPLVSNLFLGLILTLLEKLVEMEFSCPCVSGWNVAFACLFFSIPGFLSFVLMMCIRGCKSIESVCQCCIPTLMWLTLTFLDGQYFACAMTYWSGSYETVPQSAHRKWCKPDNTSNEPPEELLRMTQLWFTVSQVRKNRMSL